MVDVVRSIAIKDLVKLNCPKNKKLFSNCLTTNFSLYKAIQTMFVDMNIFTYNTE